MEQLQTKLPTQHRHSAIVPILEPERALSENGEIQLCSTAARKNAYNYRPKRFWVTVKSRSVLQSKACKSHAMASEPGAGPQPHTSSSHIRPGISHTANSSKVRLGTLNNLKKDVCCSDSYRECWHSAEHLRSDTSSDINRSPDHSPKHIHVHRQRACATR